MFDLDHIKKTYLKMALPVVLGMVVSLIYNIADTWFISQTHNVPLIEGVSLCSPLFTLLMAFGNIGGQGGSSLISRLLGAKEEQSVKRVSSFCFYSAIAVGAVVSAICLIFQTPVLKLLGAQSTNIEFARAYFVAFAAGAPIVVLNFIHSNLVRCEGMAGMSMLGSLCGTVINIILDPIFIFTLDMGARGAAVATVIGYAVTDIFFLILLRSKREKTNLSVNPKCCRINGKELGQILGVGFTAAITNIMSSVCMVLMNHMLKSYDGAVASMGMVLKVNMIAQLIMIGFAFGGVPVYGFIYGSHNDKKLKELSKFCLTFLTSLGLVLSAGLILLARPIMSNFADGTGLLDECEKMLRFQTAGTVFVAVVLFTSVLFQATGKVVPAFIMSVSRQGIVFLIAIVVLKNIFGYNGVLASQAVADLLSAILGVALYMVTFNKRKEKVAKSEE